MDNNCLEGDLGDLGALEDNGALSVLRRGLCVVGAFRLLRISPKLCTKEDKLSASSCEVLRLDGDFRGDDILLPFLSPSEARRFCLGLV